MKQRYKKWKQWDKQKDRILSNYRTENSTQASTLKVVPMPQYGTTPNHSDELELTRTLTAPEERVNKAVHSNTTISHVTRATFDQIRKQTNAPDSTFLILRYKSDDSRPDEILFLVNDLKEQDSIKGIYYVDSPVGNSVIEAILTDLDYFELNNFKYQILDIYKHSSIETILEGKKQIINVLKHPNELVDVYVYELKGLCRKHGELTEKMTVNMLSSRSSKPHPFEIYYCPICKRYYVNYETYLRFYTRYGIPPLRLHGDSATSNTNNQYASFRQYSDLYLFGYSVSDEMGLNQKMRQGILEDIINSGNLTKAQVTNHLEWLIRFSRNNEKMKDACQKWRTDLEHIESYEPKTTDIWGKFVPGNNKVFL